MDFEKFGLWQQNYANKNRAEKQSMNSSHTPVPGGRFLATFKNEGYMAA